MIDYVCFGEQPQIAETQITQLDSTNVTRHEQYMIQYKGEFGHMRSKFYRVQRPDPLQSNVTNTDDKVSARGVLVIFGGTQGLGLGRLD